MLGNGGMSRTAGTPRRRRGPKLLTIRQRIALAGAVVAALVVMAVVTWPRQWIEEGAALPGTDAFKSDVSAMLLDLGVIARPLEWSDDRPPAAGLRFPSASDRRTALEAMERLFRYQRIHATRETPAAYASEPGEPGAVAPAAFTLRRRGAEVRLVLFTRGDTRGSLALVIDDVGNAARPVRTLLGLGVPITYAVLPHTPHGRALADEARAAGAEVILHMPMEPLDPSAKLGPGALLEAMRDWELRAALIDALAWIGETGGVSNHMGSRLTADRAKMREVMGVLARHGLYFLDSRTTAATVALDAAREAGVRAVERKVFLDDDRSTAAIEAALDAAVARARAGEDVVAIGHPYKETVEVLARRAPELRRGPPRLTYVGDLVGRADRLARVAQR